MQLKNSQEIRAIMAAYRKNQVKNMQENNKIPHIKQTKNGGIKETKWQQI